MPITAQEQLLQQRCNQLDAMDRQVSALNPTDAQGSKDQQALRNQIAAQRAVIAKEGDIRARYRAQAEGQQQLAQHEAIKKRAIEAQRNGTLTKAQVAEYRASKAACQDKLRAAGVADTPFDAVSAGAALQANKVALQSDFNTLRAANIELYKNGSEMANPCMPCLQGKASVLSKNIEHRARATTSAKAFNGQQKHKDTCALMSTQSILLEKDGTAPAEGWSSNPSEWTRNGIGVTPTFADVKARLKGTSKRDMIDIGNASGGFSTCNGTTNEAAVMNEAGIPAEQVHNPKMEDVAAALDQGKAVIVGYDARPTWYGTDRSQWPDDKRAGHAVRATGVDRAPDGSIRGFYINDSGSGESGKYLTATEMKMALEDDPYGRMAVSKAPILPSVH